MDCSETLGKYRGESELRAKDKDDAKDAHLSVEDVAQRERSFRDLELVAVRKLQVDASDPETETSSSEGESVSTWASYRSR